jgi:hypothetical protein
MRPIGPASKLATVRAFAQSTLADILGWPTRMRTTWMRRWTGYRVRSGSRIVSPASVLERDL